jgi:hypothetical protein
MNATDICYAIYRTAVASKMTKKLEKKIERRILPHHQRESSEETVSKSAEHTAEMEKEALINATEDNTSDNDEHRTSEHRVHSMYAAAPLPTLGDRTAEASKTTKALVGKAKHLIRE